MKNISTNNFDTCSYAPNIEIDLFRDSDCAQRDFDENFECINGDVWFFQDNERLDWSDVTELSLINWGAVTQHDAKQYLEENDAQFADYQDVVNFDFIKEAKDFFIRTTEKEDIVCGENIEIPSKASCNFERVRIRGYSQRDFSQIIVLKDTYESFWPQSNASEKHMKMRDNFCDMFYNQPIYCLITINGAEYPLHENMESRYEYDKEELLKLLIDSDLKSKYHAGDFAKIMDYVRDNLPNTFC